MSKNYAIIIRFVLPLTFYRSGAQKSNVYKRDAFVTSWRFHNRAWQTQRHDRLPETSGTLWIHRGALTNQRCSLATGCGIKNITASTTHKSVRLIHVRALRYFRVFNIADNGCEIQYSTLHTGLNTFGDAYTFNKALFSTMGVDDIFTCIFLNEKVWISINISLKFVPKSQINNIPLLVQIMAWGRPGDKQCLK